MARKRSLKPSAWSLGDRSQCPVCKKNFKHCPHSILQADEADARHQFAARIAQYRKKGKL